MALTTKISVPIPSWTFWKVSLRVFFWALLLYIGAGVTAGIYFFFTERQHEDKPSSVVTQSVFHVNRVIDGDTFTINYDGEETSCRLALIDTPEMNEQGGKESKLELQRILSKSRDTVIISFPLGRKRDNFGRLLIEAKTISGASVNMMMVRRGGAVVTNVKGRAIARSKSAGARLDTIPELNSLGFPKAQTGRQQIVNRILAENDRAIGNVLAGPILSPAQIERRKGTLVDRMRREFEPIPGPAKLGPPLPDQKSIQPQDEVDPDILRIRELFKDLLEPKNP